MARCFHCSRVTGSLPTGVAWDWRVDRHSLMRSSYTETFAESDNESRAIPRRYVKVSMLFPLLGEEAQGTGPGYESCCIWFHVEIPFRHIPSQGLYLGIPGCDLAQHGC